MSDVHECICVHDSEKWKKDRVPLICGFIPARTGVPDLADGALQLAKRNENKTDTRGDIVALCKLCCFRMDPHYTVLFAFIIITPIRDNGASCGVSLYLQIDFLVLS